MSETTQSKRPEVIEGQEAQDLALQMIRTSANRFDDTDRGFVDDEVMSASREGGFGANSSVELELEEPVDVPMHMIVGAAGFESWEGRGPKALKDKKPSKEVIEDYAGRDTDIPEIDMGLQWYLDDSGNAFAISNNAHRTAAARLRGQDSIKAKGTMSIYHLAQTPDQLHF